MSEARILCVDDEPNVLSGLERVLGFDFDVHTATSGKAGLEQIESTPEPFAVVISDMRMPIMDGATFLSAVRDKSPRSVRMLLTGHTDMNAAISAVNEGQIFRFLTKPCPGPLLVQNVESACEQFHLQEAERELLEQTLRGAVRVLSEVLSLVNPVAFSRAERVGGFVKKIAEHCGLEQIWQLEIAALLSQIGCVTVPPEVLEKVDSGQNLAPEEIELYRGHSALAHGLLSRIPRLELVAAIVREQRPVANLEDELGEADAAFVRRGGELLRLALELDRLVVQRGSLQLAVQALCERHGDMAPELRAALEALQAKQLLSVLDDVLQLEPGMEIDKDIRSSKGMLLVAKGPRVTETLIRRLWAIQRRQGPLGPIHVARS